MPPPTPAFDCPAGAALFFDGPAPPSEERFLPIGSY